MSLRVLVTGARAPVALDCARAFAAAGHEVHMADSVTPWAARWSSPRLPIHRLPPPRQAFAAFCTALETLIADAAIDVVLPTCEEVFYVAAAAEGRFEARVIAPPLPTLRTLHSKIAFARLATEIGLDMPETVAIEEPAALSEMTLDGWVLKREFSRFGATTLIKPNPRQIAQLDPSPAQRWAAQRFVEGDEICLWSMAHHGRITALAAYRPRWRHGRSAAYAFESLDCPSAAAVAHRIAEATGATGHLSFDIILTPGGRACPIECNPRAVSGLHLYDAQPALAAACLGEPAPPVPAGRLRHLAPAMAALGVPSAIRRGTLGTLVSDWRNGHDVVGRPGDRWPVAGALIDAARFAAFGAAHWRSPTRETTGDIEWNGEPIG